MAVVVKAVLGYPILFGIGEVTKKGTKFSGDWDVHWGVTGFWENRLRSLLGTKRTREVDVRNPQFWVWTSGE